MPEKTNYWCMFTMTAWQLCLLVSAVFPSESIMSKKGAELRSHCKSHLCRNMESWQLLSVKHGYWMEEGHVSCHLNLKGHLIRPTGFYNPSNHSTKSFLGHSEFLSWNALSTSWFAINSQHWYQQWKGFMKHNHRCVVCVELEAVV